MLCGHHVLTLIYYHYVLQIKWWPRDRMRFHKNIFVTIFVIESYDDVFLIFATWDYLRAGICPRYTVY